MEFINGDSKETNGNISPEESQVSGVKIDTMSEVNFNQNGKVQKFLIPSYLMEGMPQLENGKNGKPIIINRRRCSPCVTNLCATAILAFGIIFAAMLISGSMFGCAYYLKKLNI